MTEIIRTLNMQVKEGPRFAFNDTITVEAYDKIDVEVPGGGEWLNVQVQPATLDDMEFLLIVRTDKPVEGVKRLIYKVNDDTTEVELTSLHLAMGSGVFGLLKESPNSIRFKNEDENPAKVTILVARRATPEPETEPEEEEPEGEAEPTQEGSEGAHPESEASSAYRT